MKPTRIHRLFSAFLALLILTSSVGLTVQSHSCTISGRSTASIIFSAAQHQCPSVSEGAVPGAPGAARLQKACCEFGAHFHKLEAAARHSDPTKLLLPQVSPVWYLAAYELIFPAAPSTSSSAAWHASDASPPPRAGRVLLTFVCTWQV
ncbi:HYC_CC_PP family protein [Hymenobacter elongatus]|uniref:Uncharacterized protein n=1 Tax=Hymenobacter elongatus TaxID=877208 RepID=A0A4Z0PHF0_9BACT|nr:hypothetical protein [Hymenobacter elongatus]TGE14638.1 hypothetical protein E5J99_15330 [Hymenobacter elongatus]